MDSMDDDSPMPDASEVSSRNDQSRAMREVRRSMNGALISAPPALKSSDVPNGFLNFSESLTSRLGVTTQASSFGAFDHASRDSSVFAKDVSEQHSTSSSRGSTTPSEDARGTDAVAEAQLRRGLAMLRTGLCYDVRMRYHCELDPPKQRVDFHPEDPRRIYIIYDTLVKAGLVDDRDTLKDLEGAKILVPSPLMRVFARPATEAEICLVHDKKHYDFIESTKGPLSLSFHGFLTWLSLADFTSRYDRRNACAPREAVRFGVFQQAHFSVRLAFHRRSHRHLQGRCWPSAEECYRCH